MYIKQVVIHGFKSYKDQTEVEEFSPGHNVIVGRNGSGKSNFFAAIRFVLGDAYTSMSGEERRALLHEGSGAMVFSAYVEIIFDNSDGRFPTGNDELILRRTIGQKKDEYSIDRKHATRANVEDLFNTAGFSRSNPYYIVPQGRVTALTNMKDSERLNLLKEIAGTQVYEAKRAESVKIMKDSDNKKEKIDELLNHFKERLEELEEEKKELTQYQSKDRERRCLEYAINNRDQERYRKLINDFEEKRNDSNDANEEDKERVQEGEKEVEDVETALDDFKQQLESAETERRQLEDERKRATKERAQIELDVNRLSGEQSAAKQTKTRRDADLREVKQQLQQHEAELQQVIPEYNSKRAQEVELKQELDDANATKQRLYEKQARSSLYKSKRERDDALRREIDQINGSIGVPKATKMETEEDIARLENEIQAIQSDIAELRQRYENRDTDEQSIIDQLRTKKEDRDRILDEKNTLLREVARLESSTSNARAKIDKAESDLFRSMDGNTRRGYNSVRRLKQERNLEGVYGTVAELMEVDEKYRVAVEVTGGTSLFDWVVDNEETATKLIDMLDEQRGGRVSFMPLSRLSPKKVNMPNASDCFPLLPKLRYDPMYEKAFQHIFRKAAICPSVSIASQYARSHGLTTVTRQGDTSNKKGAIKGGYYDTTRSTLSTFRALATTREEYDKQEAQLKGLQDDVVQKEQEMTRVYGEIMKLTSRQNSQETSFGTLRQQLRDQSRALQSKRDELEARQAQVVKIDSQIRQLSADLDDKEAELDSDFKKALSSQEEQQLQQLASTIPTLTKQYREISGQRSELKERKDTLEINIESLREQLDSLTADDHDSTSAGSGSNALKDRQRELKRANQFVEALTQRLSEAESAIEQLTTQIAAIAEQITTKRAAVAELRKQIEHRQKSSETLTRKRVEWVKRVEECRRQIADLGVLPDEAYSDKYKSITPEKAVKRLLTLKSELKDFGHVNKKAFEQYNNFTKQRAEFSKRRDELEDSRSSIEELIEALNMRKDEAVERTFKQVSREFAYVFEKLVPAGIGRLIIQRKTDRRDTRPADDESDEEERERRQSTVENYIGVGIAVSFNSKHDDQQRIQQLSGGQKSLCALALVFAIQRCDPAPFYLFDEIDANLDAQYRTSVANMIHTLSVTPSAGGLAPSATQQHPGNPADNAAGEGRGAQFICTTFRPEMVAVAEKVYGVSFSSAKTSSIGVVSREKALEFIEGQAGGAAATTAAR